MEQGSDAPKPEVLSNIFTPSSDIKPLKVKLLQLKGTNEQLYSIIFNLFEKTIMIEASAHFFLPQNDFYLYTNHE